MTTYEEARAKLKKTQINKLKPAAKNKTGTALRITKKNFQDNELSHKLFLTTRQKTKITNAFANSMSTGITLSKAQLSKIFQSGWSFGCWLGNLGKKTLRNISITFARDNLPGIVCNIASNVINKFEREIRLKGAARAGKGFTLFILNEDMDDFIKIIKSLEDSEVLIGVVTEPAKYETKKEGAFLGTVLAPLAV